MHSRNAFGGIGRTPGGHAADDCHRLPLEIGASMGWASAGLRRESRLPWRCPKVQDLPRTPARTLGMGARRIAVVVVLGAVLAACLGDATWARGFRDPAPTAAFAFVRLYALPAQALTQCHLAPRVQLCPQSLPRAWIAYHQGATPPALSASRFAAGRNGDAVEVGISFTYGAPWEPDSGPDWRQHAWRNRPCCFFHFDLWHALRGKPTFPVTAKPATLGGQRGDLALAAGAGLACGQGNAGVYFCNHVRFRWKQGRSWFVATLHSFGNIETTALLDRIIRELRPIRLLPRS